MEAIAIKPQWRHEAFHGAVDEVQDPTGVERIPLTRETDSEWLKQVGLVRDLLPTTDVALDPTDVYRTLGLHEGGTVWFSRRPRRPEVRHTSPPSRLPQLINFPYIQGGWTPLGRLRLALSEAAQRRKDLNLDGKREFLWVTEFPLFTRADEDKEFLAHGRWSSSHHPFTAPMHEDVEKLLANDVEEVACSCLSFHSSPTLTFTPAGPRAALRLGIERRRNRRRFCQDTRCCDAAVGT